MLPSDSKTPPLIGVVGPCASGKSTISAALRALGVNIKPICQEHSYVPTMWQRVTHPDILVFLDASHDETMRRKQLNWTEQEYQEQHRRLSHARLHADFYFFTDGETPEETLNHLYQVLSEHGLV